MKSVIGQVGSAPLCRFLGVRSSVDASLGVAFVGAARRSLAQDSGLAQRAWRPTGAQTNGNGDCLCW